ncbi:hypothetical protein PPYR_11832 [Photinus pyralis]|uniref:Uncharacterized protein n=1 Tax=Photinus pyralis TaxID=7054 RepID=A0A1Y1N374_PHOPY|nr:uncharacterized protein LOC116176524 isoform X2 [Photinus pyralis]XP_031351539.1 uncharacterized protein LOC116176869 isoform X2 [Photinus pyralis]KAB0794624.1 hypothetical protein PPYR_11463 [Photinus pyralis]KAB0794993.1 hypothetical protein PPYR_11832 [Photinus pyralis]
MISSTGFRIAFEQENKVTASRKANLQKSTRKPLCDRAINHTPQPNGKVTSLKASTNVQQKEVIVQKPKEPKTYPEWFSDVCSFKGLERYDDIDIQLEPQTIDVPHLLNFMLNPKTPPIKAKEFIPQLHSPVTIDVNYDDDNFPEIPIEDIEIPECSF